MQIQQRITPFLSLESTDAPKLPQCLQEMQRLALSDSFFGVVV